MRLEGPVLVVGAGLLGTSIALALRRGGVDVALADISEDNLRIAVGLGAANRAVEDIRPQLVVVAVPPDHLGEQIAAALSDTDAVVTDVGSVKGAPLARTRELIGEVGLPRYVGSHPMAGSERSGPFAATESLFDGRPWAVVPHEGADAAAVELVTELARVCGATPVTFSPDEHDEAVARTSHLPHLLAALTAGRLTDAPRTHLALSGQGVRDVTRIAAGDPGLWQQIIGANTVALTALLHDVRDDVDRLLAALSEGDRGSLGALLDRGVQGTAVIPGKHGAPTGVMAVVYVAVPDHPGELARLFADAGEIGVNIEDMRIDHDQARAYGLVELTVSADSADRLLGSLEERRWTVHR
ncbi:MAG: prephenate dehydrogenase [Nocardioidaceae bacterium]